MDHGRGALRPTGEQADPGRARHLLPFALREVALLRELRVIVCLGAFAWDAALRLRAAAGHRVPRPRPRFGHEAVLDDGAWLPLLGCFHPSQQNTFTGRLTPAMLDRALAEAMAMSNLT